MLRQQLRTGAFTSPASGAGHFVVSLGTYSNAGNAESIVSSLKESQLPAYADTVTVGACAGWRLRADYPFAQRGDAEAARLRAQQVRSDMPASVTTLTFSTAPSPMPSQQPITATSPDSVQLTGTFEYRADDNSTAPGFGTNMLPANNSSQNKIHILFCFDNQKTASRLFWNSNRAFVSDMSNG